MTMRRNVFLASKAATTQVLSNFGSAIGPEWSDQSQWEKEKFHIMHLIGLRITVPSQCLHSALAREIVDILFVLNKLYPFR